VRALRQAGVNAGVLMAPIVPGFTTERRRLEATIRAVAEHDAAFMGALRVRRGERINAHAVPQDDLQKRIAERIRPGVTSQSGLRGWLRRARVVDLEKTSLGNELADRESFFDAALADLGDSPWAAVIAREAASGETLVARPGTPAPSSETPAKSAVKNDADSAAQSPVPIPGAVAAKPQPTVAEPQAAPAEVEATVAEDRRTPSRNHCLLRRSRRRFRAFRLTAHWQRSNSGWITTRCAGSWGVPTAGSTA
jgi:hypothetical protein